MTSIVTPLVRDRLSANLSEVSALSALLALAPGRPQTLSTGNWQLINRLIRLSEADVRTSSKVARLRQGAEGGWLLQYANNQAISASSAEEFFN